MPHVGRPRRWKPLSVCWVFGLVRFVPPHGLCRALVEHLKLRVAEGARRSKPQLVGRGGVSCPAGVVNADRCPMASGASPIRMGKPPDSAPLARPEGRMSTAVRRYRRDPLPLNSITQGDARCRNGNYARRSELAPKRPIIVAVVEALFYSCNSPVTPFPTCGFRPFRAKRIDENATIAQVAATRRTLQLFARVHDRGGSRNCVRSRKKRGILRSAVRSSAGLEKLLHGRRRTHGLRVRFDRRSHGQLRTQAVRCEEL